MIISDYNIIRRPSTLDPEKVQMMGERMREYIQTKYMFQTSHILPEESQKLFNWIGRYRLAQIEELREQEKTQEYGFNREAISYYEQHDLDKHNYPDKGLLIIGTPGLGKTLIAKIIASIFKMEFYIMQELDEEYAQDPERCVQQNKGAFDACSPCILDDLGNETGKTHYGNEQLVTTLLPRLYDRWSLHKKQVIITSNLSTMDIKNDQRTILGRYGERIASRMHQMFEIVKFGRGEDKRYTS